MPANCPSFASKLRNVITASDKIIPSPYGRILGAHSREPFIDYLGATAHIIRASVDIMRLAEGNCAPSSSQLSKYLSEHSDEEDGHFEWLLEDIGQLVPDVAAVLDRTNLPTVLSVPGVAYYMVRNADPCSVLGYIAAMEGAPPPEAILDRLQSGLGLPPSSLRTLRLHGELDQEHRDELFEFIDACDFSDAQQKMILTTAVWTIETHAMAMADVLLRT